VKNKWFETWIMAPFVAAPAIIIDPFTLYCCALGDGGPDGSPAEDDETADPVESSKE
jgi:hypothetical protein